MSDSINTTKEGILVKPHQVWEDLDARQSGRRVTVTSVAEGKAKVANSMGRVTTLSVSRMHRHSTGWRLVQP